MRYSVRHHTSVSYAAPVAQAAFNLRLLPWNWPGQVFYEAELSLDPKPERRVEKAGPYCVRTTSISYREELEKLDLLSTFEVELSPLPLPGDGPDIAAAMEEALAVRSLRAHAPAPYMFASRIARVDTDIADWAKAFLPRNAPIVTAVSALMAAIHKDFTYRSGVTTSATPPHEVFAKREGVCQDFAHVMIVALRSCGIPAAYVSGYLRTVPPPGQERLVGADAMHAWVNVWCGQELGWVGFDPTNNCLARGDHIVIGMGRDYADVAPIDGTFIGAAPQKMTTAVDVVEAAAA